MKLTAWQMVAVLAILFAAIICANVFAPGVSAVVVSMATTALGALVLQRDDRAGPKVPASRTSDRR
ncbi:hypothetical protein [Labilithrix luteola]|uniref:hypothetical protein n=1 Tax=Labilithrix luteola TaxID=1391654 RepID=UPI0011BA7DD7|nr:hypothetical protein [Labilithrix luteola]